MDTNYKELKFDDLPEAIVEVLHKVKELRSMVEILSAKIGDKPRPPLLIDVAAAMICKSKSTIYKLVAAGDIPHHKQGNRLYFFEDELMDWIANHKSKAKREAEFKAAQNAAYEYLDKRRRKAYLSK